MKVITFHKFELKTKQTTAYWKYYKKTQSNKISIVKLNSVIVSWVDIWLIKDLDYRRYRFRFVG